MNSKIILGIEGSANKLGVGIITSTGKILANERKTYSPKAGEGFIPSVIAEHHSNHILETTKRALVSANLSIKNIDLLAYTRGPGIASALSIISTFVHALATLHKIPVIPVNHCIAHIEMGLEITKSKSPLVVYVSGGNSQLIYFKNMKYNIISETLDSALGNVIDKLARVLHLPNVPAPGFNVELYAEKFAFKNSEETKKEILKKYSLKVPIRGWDVILTGVVEQIIQKIKKKVNIKKIAKIKPGLDKNSKNLENLDLELKEEICWVAQESLFGAFGEISDRIIKYLNSENMKKHNGGGIEGIMMTGGVACNKRFQEKLKEVAEKNDIQLYGMDEKYCIDNGLMIAWAGWLAYKGGEEIDPNKMDVVQRWRTDTVDVNWK